MRGALAAHAESGAFRAISEPPVRRDIALISAYCGTKRDAFTLARTDRSLARAPAAPMSNGPQHSEKGI